MIESTVPEPNNKFKFLCIIPWCWFLSNFVLLSFMGKSLRPMDILVPIIVLVFAFSVRKIRVNPVMILMFVLPFGSIFNVIDKNGFINSYLFYFLEIFVLYVMFGNINYIPRKIKEDIIKTIFVLFLVCTVFGIIQFILANFLGNNLLYNCFGALQYHKHYYNRLRGITRATSIFYEPSVYGWVSVVVFSLNEYLDFNTYKWTIRIAVIISLVISFSASGIIGLAIAFLLFTFQKSNNLNGFIKLIMIILLLILIILSNYDIEGMLRLNTVSIQGSSGYNRLQYPVDAAIETLSVYPVFGRGLGQIGVLDYKITNYGEIYNSIFGIFVVFGLSGLLLYLHIIKIFVKWYMINKNSLIFDVVIIYLLFSNGSFLTLEFPLVAIFFEIAIMYKSELQDKYHHVGKK